MSTATPNDGETAMITISQHDDDVINIADETHNYSYCSDHSMPSPMCITPKPSTRTLIDFWSNPHESGMTMSFSQYEKSSTGSSSNPKTNGSIQSLNYSPETSLGSIPLHMKMLLDVTCDDEDEDRNEVTEATESTTENHEDVSESHPYSCASNGMDDTGGLLIEVENTDNVRRQSPECIEPASMVVYDADHDTIPTPTTVTPVDAAIDDQGVVMASPSKSQNEMTPSFHIATPNGPSKYSTTPLLPPLPPTARRSNRKIVEGNALSLTREQYIAKAIERRNLPSTNLTLNRSTDSLLPNTSPTTDTSVATIPDISPSVPFIDTSLSTIHDEMEQSSHGKIENNTEKELPNLEKSTLAENVVAMKHPFSPEREVILYDDDILDLTSIHSEDSDGEILRNTRHHVVDIEENHHSLIQDVCISNNQDDADDDDDLSYYDDDLVDTEPKHTASRGNNSLIEVDASLVTPSISDNVKTATVTISKDIDESDLKEDIDVGDSREHNRSNDTEHMLANVIDAAEKSILKGQEEQSLLSPHQLEPSMFFDCEEYDAASQIRANESSLPLKFLTLNDPLSPLATIHDCEVYENMEINKYEAHMATSPVSYPSEHLFTRITPLRSNSSRVEDVSKVSSSISDNITVPPLKKKTSKKKLLPRIDGTEHLPGTNKKEYRKREKRLLPARMVEDVDDDELSSSVSTLDMDDEKEESTDLFWIDAFLDFVSPPEDSRSIGSDSSTSTGTGSNGATIRNADASVGNTISTPTEHGSSQKQFRIKKKPPTSLSRLREWWQKELIEEVMKGSLAKPLHDSESDSVDLRGANDTVEKIVSHEFHKVLYGQKVSLLGSKKSPKEDQEKKPTQMNASDWLEALKATIESAASASLGCGASESAVADEQVQVNDTAFVSSPKSFDSLDDLVRELKNTKIETDPAVLRGHFQSMYNQLQQKFIDANLYDQTLQEEATHSPAKQDVPNTEISENIEQRNDDGPCVEVLPDDSLQFLLHSTTPMYSPPTSDYLQQSDDIPSRRSGKSKTRVAKALAQAKAAIAQRRRAAVQLNSVAPKKETAPSIEHELSEALKATKEEGDVSVALADLDISMEESTNLDDLDISMEQYTAEDDIRVTFNDPSSFISDLNTTDPCSIDRSVSDIVESSNITRDLTCSNSMQHEERPEASLVFLDDGIDSTPQRSHQHPTEFLKDATDKINVTKETVTDNSGSEDSINIASELDQLITSRIQTNCPGRDTSTWESVEPQVEITTASESLSGNDSQTTGNDEYHLLDSSNEKQCHELSTSDQMPFIEGVHFTDKINNFKLSRSSTLTLRSIGSRSSNLKMMTLLSSEDESHPKQRLGFKSKAFRKAQSYVAMQTIDHNNSVLSTPKSTSTYDSALPVLNGKVYAPKEVRPATDERFTKKSKLGRNSSLLSIIRKKTKKERSIDTTFDILKTNLITSAERGSDDDTSPHGNDFDWEEFPSNTFYTSHSSKAEI